MKIKKNKFDDPVEFICDCGSIEHQIRVSYDVDCQNVYVMMYLRKHKFFSRLWHGIKYIFGYQCKYGGFEEVVLDVEKIKEMKKFLQKCIKDIES